MEEDTVVEIVVSVVAVLVFVAAVVVVGTSFGVDGLSRTGALALVGVVFGFVLLMTAVGYFLAGR